MMEQEISPLEQKRCNTHFSDGERFPKKKDCIFSEMLFTIKNKFESLK